MIKVLFFAQLRVQMGREEFYLEDFSGSLEQLRIRLHTLLPECKEILQSGDIQAAVNWEMVAPSAPVRDGDEVAFFPPVTGG